jgi:flagellar motility protein MotE (MotC chaperone)
MEFRLRLMPLAMVATLGLLGLKLAHLWLAVDTAPFGTAWAEQASEKPAKAPAKAAAAPAAAEPAAAAAPPPSAGEKPATDKPRAIDPTQMSPAELELLQKLSERRAELERRAAELSQREVLLQATEKRIDEKIARLASLEKDIGGIVDKQSEENEARIKSLVKIYETMKPHDAARIFEQLDMPVLLGVLEHMKERSAAPILAALDPGRAKAVTLALAERKDQRAKAEDAVAKPAQKDGGKLPK